MRKIKLTQGKFALVDNEDFEKLSKYKWCAYKKGNTYYAVTGGTVDGGKNRMHRFILGLTKGDGKITDHKNRNGLDNRRSNLRVVSVIGNQRNRKISAKNTSGHTGVYWYKDRKKWVAQIGVNNKLIHLGLFDDIKNAVKARKKGELKYWKGG